MLTSNTIGAHNTGIGEDSLNNNLSGNHNTAWGESTLYNNTAGSDNVAGGYYALNKSMGSNNVAIGHQASYVLASGDFNTALGYQAGFNATSGSYNLSIANAGVTADNNTIRIGTKGSSSTGVTTGQNRAFIAGISGRGVTGTAVYVSSNGQLEIMSSSKRFKKDIRSVDIANKNILDLRPVSFRYKAADDQGEHPLQYGLIAEEVATIFPDLVQYDENGKAVTVYYHLLTPLLLAALQQEHKNAEKQLLTVSLLRKQNEIFRAELLAVRNQMPRQAAQITSISNRRNSAQVDTSLSSNY